MKVLSATQMKQVDALTLQGEGISAIDLMERASKALFTQLNKDLDLGNTSLVIFCGPGNNGGDGLALARLLHDAGHQIFVYLLTRHRYSPENITNQKRLLDKGIIVEKIDPTTVIEIPSDALIVDAFFGSGTSRPLSSDWKKFIGYLNSHSNTRVAIDIPSGLIADAHVDQHSPVIKADYTYTFQSPKLCLLLPENARYIGEVVVVDIGLDQLAMKESGTSYYYTIREDIIDMIPKFNRFAHKGTFGHAFIVGGSFGKIGAIALSCKAALKTGCGMVSSYIPACGYAILQSSFPEAMVLTDEDTNSLSTVPDNFLSYSSIGIGMGMGTDQKAQQALFLLLSKLSEQQNDIPLMVDADALNILAIHPEWLKLLPPLSILTPHPKELERLIGPWKNDFEKLQKALYFSNTYEVITIIKGANTAIVFPDGQIHFNSTGNWGMATAGSGDVLSGMISSLLAQGFSPQDTARAGVFLHGLAADLTIRKIHPKSLIASDLIEHISSAWDTVAPMR
ncbi:NAD(P)H-hydrate dehydratase [Sphingobacterium pedocola]|uniref:Bifunctional NAD(P)H-hydrate repair enzyme n=1 Tax=Sphingobacterium pedocola TaxID=2082722 RepID=A0ABR9TCK6_9SPHI|nr:NAD(P)H-hydrate dehydratase [Sphingobacterium pedocola]MBE8723059.1 bifunctional ADP-dependent NAD(P)H-hydrate dehydratase/NAD(P)H-hydrate epimerase [Sphingobacterium pedocola]